MRENRIEFFKGIFFGFLFALLLGFLSMSLLHLWAERQRKLLSEKRKIAQPHTNYGMSKGLDCAR